MWAHVPSHTPLLPGFSGKCQEKISFLVFDASVVSEELGLNELEEVGWRFRITFIHFSLGQS